MTRIHPSSIIDPTAEIATDVSIGPFCSIGAHVKIASDVYLAGHVHIDAHTHIGSGCRFGPFSAVGTAPQHRGYQGETTQTYIGCNNQFFEYCTVHRGTQQGGGVTRIGDNNFFMFGAHVAHDCVIGNHVTLSAHAIVSGHVHLSDHAYIGATTMVREYVRIGEHVYISRRCEIGGCVAPYLFVNPHERWTSGVNVKGLRDRKFNRQDIRFIQKLYTDLYVNKTGTFEQRIKQAQATYTTNPLARTMLDFLVQSKNDVRLPIA